MNSLYCIVSVYLSDDVLQVTITGFDLTSYRQCLQRWNNAIATMYEQCQLVGSSRCMMVYYEQLVLHPAQSMKEILKFLDVPWNESVLHHEDHINKPGGVSLSKWGPLFLFPTQPTPDLPALFFFHPPPYKFCFKSLFFIILFVFSTHSGIKYFWFFNPLKYLIKLNWLVAKFTKKLKNNFENITIYVSLSSGWDL